MTASDAGTSPLAVPGPWDKVALGYERYTRGFLAKFSEQGLGRLELGPEHRLLDVACGPGTTSLLAASKVRSIDAIDFSTEMVEIFRRKIELGPVDNIELHVGDGQALPFEDESFDRAVSMFGLMFFPDRLRGMKEIHRCLKPGGRVLLSSWAPVSMSPLMQAMFDAGRAANPDNEPPKANLDSLENPVVFERELLQAGFSNIRIEPCLCHYDYESGEQLWSEMLEGAVPLVLSREAATPEAWEAFSSKCREYLISALAERPALGSTAYLAIAER